MPNMRAEYASVLLRTPNIRLLMFKLIRLFQMSAYKKFASMPKHRSRRLQQPSIFSCELSILSTVSQTLPDLCLGLSWLSWGELNAQQRETPSLSSPSTYKMTTPSSAIGWSGEVLVALGRVYEGVDHSAGLIRCVAVDYCA
jgi:hypothetical protein